MPKRTYGQPTPVARALDVLGERWALLIVRELLLGPKRFKELLELLPVTGTNRLAERLRELEADGVVTRRPLAGSPDVRVYDLTPLGQRLRPMLTLLSAWGTAVPLDERIDRRTARRELMTMALVYLRPRNATTGMRETYEFHVGDEVFHVVADDGTLDVRSGRSPQAAELVVTCGPRTYDRLVRGRITLRQAVAEDLASVSGDESLLDHVFAVVVQNP